MKKKLLASILALSLTAGLTVPAFAVDQTVDKTGTLEITVSTVLNLPTISVTIADPSAVVVNPYKQEYTLASTTASHALISNPSSIKNASNVGVDISATPSVSTNSESLVIRTSPIEDRSTKQLFMKLNMAPVTQESDVTSYTGAETGTQSAVIKTGDALETATITLAQGDTTATWGAMKITGDSCGSGWTDSDAITLKIVFDIQPQMGT